MTDHLWGFCDCCERWRLSAEWRRDSPKALCPVCETPPLLLETINGDIKQLRMTLELPPGNDLPLLH